jgi:hypothetical protein
MTILCPITCLNRINKLADSNRRVHSKLVFTAGSFSLLATAPIWLLLDGIWGLR